MNETPTSENGIWFLVEEIGVLLLPCGVGPESLQMQLPPPPAAHVSLYYHQERTCVL